MSGVTGAGVTGPVSFLVSIDDLTTEQQLAIQKETMDRNALLPFTNPTSDFLTPLLKKWSSIGFPDYYTIFSVTVTPPQTCSDGITRDFVGYLAFLIGNDLITQITKFDSLLKGITAGYGITGSNLNIIVSKTK